MNNLKLLASSNHRTVDRVELHRRRKRCAQRESEIWKK